MGFSSVMDEDGRDGGTHFAINLVLLVLALLLNHEDRVVEQEDLELGALALRPTAFLERSLVDDLALLVSQSQVLISHRQQHLNSLNKEETHDGLSILEDELLIELREIEPILTPPRLDVDLGEELAHKFDDLGQRHLVAAVLGGVLEAGFEEKGVSSESGRRFREVSVQFELARFRQSLRFLHTRHQYVGL